jgi:glycogen phosphorylase
MKKGRQASIDGKVVLQNMVATNQFGTFFGISQKVLDSTWNELTSPEGNSVTYISMEIGADRDVFQPVKQKLLDLDITGSSDAEVDSFVKHFLKGPEKIPNYGGGLGILAGDTLKSFSDNQIPVIGISLLYRKGYFSQLVDSKLGQISWIKDWDVENTPTIYPLKDPDQPDRQLEIEVPFYDQHDQKTKAIARLWVKMEINHSLDFFIPEILLDFSIDKTPDWIRGVAGNLYDSTSEQAKVIQRRLLGAGVIPTMKALGVTSKTIHLNEQHGVVLVLQLIAEELKKNLGEDYHLLASDEQILKAADTVSERMVYTIHTPVKAGHDRFDKGLYSQVSHSFCQRVLQILAIDQEHPGAFNFTSLAMRVNRATNSVSRLHKDVTKRQFPEYASKITAITNGVHHLTWISQAKAELYSSFKELDNWQKNPRVFKNAKSLLKNNKFRKYFAQAWYADTRKLTDYVNQMLLQHRNQIHETWIDPPNYLSHLNDEYRELSPDVFTIGFARRFSTYKRADLIFDNLEVLSTIIKKHNRPVNFIYAGKAHPADEPGKHIIKLILDIQEELYELSNGLAKLIFIPNYDMNIAKMMVSGVHAWLNSPKRPLEASGTSGMKAAINGVPNISTMDGWWVEGYHKGQTGWKFGYEEPVEDSSFSEAPDALLYAEDSESFYQLFPELLNSFYGGGNTDYLDKCIMNLVLNCPIFNTHRMAAEYVNRYNLSLPTAKLKKIKSLAKLYVSDKY